MKDIQLQKQTQLQTQLKLLGELKEEAIIEENLLLEKARLGNNPNDILTASSYMNNLKSKKRKSYLFDPYYFNESLGYKDKPLRVSYSILKQMARAPIMKAIIYTRNEQIASFAKFQDDEQRIGWSIRKKKGFVYNAKDIPLTDQEKVQIEGIIDFLMNAGIKKNQWTEDDLETFFRKLVPDTLIMDQMTFEVVRNRMGNPIEYFATDGATYRLAESYSNDRARAEQVQINGYYPSYVQIYQGLVNEEFYPWELCFGIRNQTTNIYNNGYGESELENMIKIVTWQLYADSYNGKFFSQGSSPKGMLKITGAVDEDKLAEFKSEWRAQISGVENAWRIPVIEGAEGVEWVDMQMPNKDMEFSKWQEYLIRLSCALYKMDPSEIGFFMASSSGGTQATIYEGNNEYKLKYSKDKGLYPLLRFIERKMNKYLVGPLSDDRYEWFFTGIEDDTDQKKLDDDIKKIANFTGLKEMRRMRDMPDHIDDDDIILNPVWLQNKQLQMQGAMQSNQFVDQMNGNENPFAPGGGDGNNPFQQGQQNGENPFQLEAPKSSGNPNAGNPFMKDFNTYVDKLIHKAKDGEKL